MDSRPLRCLLDRLRRATALPDDGLGDAELLRRFVCRRDEAAFEVLVWRHGPMVLGVCRRVLRDAHAAEDAFQATFLVLARKAGSIARGAAVAPWLYHVAFRIALRARAALARRPAQALPADLCAPATAGPAERDWQPILDEEINRLPERYRRPVVLCHLQGHTLAEAARQLGCPRGTVAVRLVRARQRLRARLTRRGVTLAATLPAALASKSAVLGALVQASVRGALGYALSPSVLTLTEGVLRAMLLSKLKWVAVVLMVTALAGGGAAWISYRAGAGTEVRGAPDRRAEDERAAAVRRQEQQKHLDRAPAQARADPTPDQQVADLVEAYRDLPAEDKIGAEGDRILGQLHMVRGKLSPRSKEAVARLEASQALRGLAQALQKNDQVALKDLVSKQSERETLAYRLTEAVPYIEPSPRRWEYKILRESFVEKLGEGELAAGLGQLGDDGWELVGFENGRLVFKRQK
jgi:RNA polymerase sigma factor (sigma-70 family)